MVVDVEHHRQPDRAGHLVEDLGVLLELGEARLDAGVKRLRNPHRYHVSLSERLWRLRQVDA